VNLIRRATVVTVAAVVADAAAASSGGPPVALMVLGIVAAAFAWAARRLHRDAEHRGDAPEGSAGAVHAQRAAGASGDTHVVATSHLERQLRAQRRAQHRFVELVPVPVFVKDAATLQFTAVNLAFEQLIGLPRSEILGRGSFPTMARCRPPRASCARSGLHGAGGRRWRTLGYAELLGGSARAQHREQDSAERERRRRPLPRSSIWRGC
jgi:PAS domain-containing protein